MHAFIRLLLRVFIAFGFGLGAAGLVALASITGGIAGFIVGVPAALSVYCLATGVTLGVLIPFAAKGSRAAWATMVAILAVDALGTFFGAGPLARALDVSVPVAVIVPFVIGAGVIALAAQHRTYQDA